jgi:tetratricopeptide (TPR) repeat protein
MEFEETIALDRNNASGMLQLGFTLVVLGQPEAALPYFEKAIRLNPRNKNIQSYYLGLGECYMFLGHLNEAVDLLRKARASNPAFFYIPVNLAAALGLRGDVAEAKGALAEALKLKPEIRSLADLHRLNSNYSNPPFAALVRKTIDVGLRRAGMPDE